MESVILMGKFLFSVTGLRREVLSGWSRRGLGEQRTGGRGLGMGTRGAYLDTQQSCCKVSALAMAHYTGCCRRRTHRNECDSASPPHM